MWITDFWSKKKKKTGFGTFFGNILVQVEKNKYIFGLQFI